MNDSWWIFTRIMLFYVILSYVIVPIIFYHASGKKLSRAGDGFVAGSVLSIILWYTYGSKMVK